LSVEGLTITPMDVAAARVVVTWRYPPPHDVYNVGDEAVAAVFLASVGSGYYQLRDRAGELAAFCCFGAEARVPGGDYAALALDIGIGVRPDLTGRGQGMRYLGAVIDFGVAQFAPELLRLTVAAFNARAIRLYERAGFRAAQRFRSSFIEREFILMTRPAAAGAPGRR
jgi:ribosomal-protein-alanine N-acetyltransferase